MIYFNDCIVKLQIYCLTICTSKHAWDQQLGESESFAMSFAGCWIWKWQLNFLKFVFKKDSNWWWICSRKINLIRIIEIDIRLSLLYWITRLFREHNQRVNNNIEIIHFYPSCECLVCLLKCFVTISFYFFRLFTCNRRCILFFVARDPNPNRATIVLQAVTLNLQL